MKNLVWASVLLAMGTLCAVEIDKMELQGATRTKGILHFDGSSSAVIPNSAAINVDEPGLTLLVTVKPQDSGTAHPQPDALDMYVFKPDQFLFGRLGGSLYANFHDGKAYCVHTLAPVIPPPGKWSQVAAVFEAYDDSAQGDKGYYVSIYLNGRRCVQRKFRGKFPQSNTNSVTVGKGWGGPWHFRGDVGDVQLIPRPLSEGEIAQAFQKDQFVDKDALLEQQAYNVSEKAWVNRVLQRSKRKVAGKVADLWKKNSSSGVVSFFRQAPQGIRLIETPALFLLVDTNADSGHPLLGIYDRKGKYDVTAPESFGWRISARSGKDLLETSSAQSKGYAVMTSAGFQAIWQSETPFRADVTSDFTVSDSRIAASLQVQNHSADARLFQVVFPSTKFHQIAEKDTLLFPFMCGVEVQDPTVKRFRYGQSGFYPCGSVTMQYSGYYGGGRGLYFAFEDPHAYAKKYEVAGKNSLLEFQWSHPVAYKRGVAGGNSFVSPGSAVLSLSKDDWYSVTSCYRKFAETTDWWLKELPRKETPEWYRTSLLRMSYYTSPDQHGLETSIREFRYLREYFDHPISMMWYHWDDQSKGHWPHFQPRAYLLPIFQQLAKEGILIEPYMNPRLWKQLDGPGGKKDWLYSTVGSQCAVKDSGMKIPFEHYLDGDFSVMCPCPETWQQKQLSVLQGIAPHVQSVYMDQAATGQPIMCFAPDHGHAINDASSWINQGFRPMIRKLRQAFPNTPLNTEEISEPYVALYDAGLVWRWTFTGQVPAFQAVYSGRFQFAGRTVDSDRGDPRANLVKMAVMLVNAEQIGRLQLSSLSEADDLRLMTKKMLHLRRALAPYFNTGKMLAPLHYVKDPVPDTRSWGTFHVPQKITMPAIISNSYETADGTMYVFVNPGEKTVSAVPDLGNGELFQCAEGESAVKKIAASAPVVLAPFASEVRFSRAEPAEAVQPVLQKMASFDRGKPLIALLDGQAEKEIAPKRGEMLMPKDASWHYRCVNVVRDFGGMLTGAIVCYGTVDFGADPVDSITLSAMVHKNYQGGTIEFLTALDNKPENCLGILTLKDTGGFDVPGDFMLKLNRPLKGKNRILLRFTRNGCCNFIGWKF